jgi:hypothetical protein
MMFVEVCGQQITEGYILQEKMQKEEVKPPQKISRITSYLTYKLVHFDTPVFVSKFISNARKDVVAHTKDKMGMKNIGVYYFGVIAPVAIIFLLSKTDTINSHWFVYSFFFYLFVYRTYIDGKRLAHKGLIEKKDIWKLILPGYRLRFFRDLYFR